MGDPGENPPLFLDQTEAQRAEKKFFQDHPPLYPRVWITAPPPPPLPLIRRSESTTASLPYFVFD